MLSVSGLIQSCISVCPLSYYPQSSTGSCQKCINNCVVCTSPSNCQKCDTSYYLYNNQCLNACPFATYTIGNSSAGYKCVDCENLCDVCTSSLSCTQCTSGSYSLDGLCYDLCPSGYYGRDIDATCQPCSIGNCNDCSSVQCYQCMSNYYGFLDISSNQIIDCVTNCGNNYFANI
jgi:hypothetical protein